MERRNFLLSIPATLAAAKVYANSAPPESNKFNLKYAPHFGMFKHHAGEGLIDQLKFCADEGFTAFEDNGMMERTIEVQENLASEMARLKITMGVFVAYAEFNSATFVKKPEVVKNNLLKRMNKAGGRGKTGQCKMVHCCSGYI